MRDRIKQIIDKEGMSQSQFADFIEVNRPTLSHILAGRNNPSLEVMMKIHQKFPQLNISWLFDGIGPMHDTDSVNFSNPSTQDAATIDQPRLSAEPSSSSSSSFPSSSSSPVYDDQQAKSRFFQGDLFAENTVFTNETTGASKNRKEIPLQTPPKATYLSDTQIEYAKKSLQRKIVEIKIFFDDGTYETFK